MKINFFGRFVRIFFLENEIRGRFFKLKKKKIHAVGRSTFISKKKKKTFFRKNLIKYTDLNKKENFEENLIIYKKIK